MLTTVKIIIPNPLNTHHTLGNGDGTFDGEYDLAHKHWVYVFVE
jgi:hypothetical protein